MTPASARAKVISLTGDTDQAEAFIIAPRPAVRDVLGCLQPATPLRYYVASGKFNIIKASTVSFEDALNAMAAMVVTRNERNQ